MARLLSGLPPVARLGRASNVASILFCQDAGGRGNSDSSKKMALSIMRELVVTLTLALVFVDAKPNLLELAKDLNLNEFVRAAKATGLDRIINHEGIC